MSEYIKKEDAIKAFEKSLLGKYILWDTQDKIKKDMQERISRLPTYSIPDSADIEKIRAEIQENLDRCKEFGWEEESRDDVIKAYTEVLEIIDKHIKGVRANE